MNIAILGAQGSGKTQLAQALVKRLGVVSNATPAAPVRMTDAPPLMAAVEADLRFNDVSLYTLALSQHTTYDLTLLMGLDLPRAAEPTAAGGVSREAVDARLRRVLMQNQLAFTVIYGLGSERIEAALHAISPQHQQRAQRPEADLSRWQSNCEKCSDPVCEHRLFTGRLKLGNR